MTLRDEVSQLLCNLVSLPSVNPCEDSTCTTVPYGEGRMAGFVESYFKPFDVQVSRQQVVPGRDNVLVRLAGEDPDARPLLLEAHMDTVDTSSMRDPFKPRVAEGRIYGRGACDTKGSLAAMMLAVRTVAESGTVPPRDVVLAGSVDEEWGMQGVRQLISSGMRFAGAIVGEPTSLRVVTAGLGQVYFRVLVQGKAAHTSTPERGVNAIYLMMDVIAALRTHSAQEFAQHPHPLCGPSLLTVSIIEGGNSEHVVPSRCQIAVDLRLTPGLDWVGTSRDLERWLRTALDAETLERVEVLEPHHDVPPLETDASSGVVRSLCSALEQEAGQSHVTGVPYNTDGSWLSAAGVPVVVFGPGDIAQAHSSNEYVELDEVERAARILTRVILGYRE